MLGEGSLEGARGESPTEVALAGMLSAALLAPSIFRKSLRECLAIVHLLSGKVYLGRAIGPEARASSQSRVGLFTHSTFLVPV
jgi:hypothetical protein